MIDAVIAKNKQLKTDNDTDLKRKFGNEKLQKAIQRLKANSRGIPQMIQLFKKFINQGNGNVEEEAFTEALKKKFDERLKDSGIDQIGICRLRREYFDQLFDEIIRQASMSCVERGQVLLTVRDEMNRAFSSYESLFCSAISYGFKSQMRAQKNVEAWQDKIYEIQEKINDLEIIQEEFVPAYNHFQQMFVNQLEFDNKEFSQEYERLQRNHFQLKVLLLSSVKDPTSTMDVSTSAEVKK